MVKNRALKRDARVIKASTGITYPRARDLITDPVDQDYSFGFGTDATGSLAVFTPAKDMHLVVTGCPGAGKTWFLHSLAADAVESMDVHFVSTAFPEEEIRTPAAVHAVKTLPDAAELLDGIMQEIAVRKWRCQEAGVDRISELPLPPRPVLIILDEFQWLTHIDPYAIQEAERSPEARGLRARIAAAVGKIAREGRTAGVSLVISSQEPDLRTLIPGPDNIMANLSQLVLGGLDYGFRRLTAGLGDPTLQALRPGTRQGIYAPLSADGGLVDIELP